MFFRYTCTFAAVVCSMIAIAQPVTSKKLGNIRNKFLDVVYSTASPANKMDIYLPSEGKGPFPVIVFIHGGAFWGGDKADDQIDSAIEGIRHGYAVVSVNYRLSREAIFPAPINDIKAAIRFIRSVDSKYNLNSDKIAVWGDSAGGHLAALAGTTSGYESMAQIYDKTASDYWTNSNVQAVVDWFGPIQFNQMDAQFKISKKGKTGHDNADSPESVLIGKQVTKAADLVKRASPATYLSKEDPPMLIQHGSIDPVVPVEQSINFYNEAVKILGKDKVTLNILEGEGHGGRQFDDPKNLAKIFAFLDKHIKN